MDNKKAIDKICNEISTLISNKVNFKVQVSVEQPDKNTDFFEPTIVLTENVADGEETKYRSRIYLTSQQNVIYYFPTPTHKQIVEKVAEIIHMMTNKEITVKEAPCKTCPNFLKCRMAFPCTIHLQQIGSYTETSCVLRKDKDTFEKEFVDEMFTPLT